MKRTKHTFVGTATQLGLLTWALVGATHATASEPGWIGGLSLGQTRTTIDDARIVRDLSAQGLTAGPLANNDRDRGFKLFGGYRFDQYFSVEGGYFDLGEFGFNTTTNPAGTLSGNIRLKGLNLDAVGTLPITDKWSVFGRVGAAHTRASDRFVGSGAVVVLNPNPRARDTLLKVGFGMEYAVSADWSVRAEVERYRVNDAVGHKGHVDLASVGLVYRFGGSTPRTAARK